MFLDNGSTIQKSIFTTVYITNSAVVIVLNDAIDFLLVAFLANVLLNILHLKGLYFKIKPNVFPIYLATQINYTKRLNSFLIFYLHPRSAANVHSAALIGECAMAVSNVPIV